jgi:sugar phosphate isomerase/epimerase
MIARRSFLKRASVVIGLGTAACTSGFIPLSSGAQPGKKKGAGAKAGAASGKDSKFKLAMAGYTFNKFNLEQTLEMMKQVDVHYLCIKDFHLPLDSSAEQIAAFHEKCKSYGVTGYGVGPIYMGSEEEVNKAFEYARAVGVKIVVGVPYKKVENKRVASTELLQVVDKKVREYDMKYAIHNHGPDMPELFPTAESVMSMIKDLDGRIGLCLDIGHQLRDGKDPIMALKQFSERVHDIHIKNVNAADKSGKSVEMPRGLINIPAFVRMLRQVGYSGMCSLEYEKDMTSPLLGVAESVGYFRGVMDSV